MRDYNRGRIMSTQRVWRPVGKRNPEIEQLHLELASLNDRIAEFEKLHPDQPKIEALKARALLLARQIDELRCSSATTELAGLLAQ
jgi:uncharacterized protein YydD (DUF2326 family)